MFHAKLISTISIAHIFPLFSTLDRKDELLNLESSRNPKIVIIY